MLRNCKALVLFAVFTSCLGAATNFQGPSKICTLRPLGGGQDDTDQVEAAIAQCGHFGKTVFEPGSYNITRKMTWDLVSSTVDLHGELSFNPDIEFWLNPDNTFRVVFIQSQASWFVVTGSDFVIDAHNTGGINGNGQPWWNFFTTRPRRDGDGRPISLTIWKAVRGTIRNFRIISPPFWSNTVAQSQDIVYDGMFINASNTNPMFFGQNIVPNTDGINTYRSDRVTFLNWDVTCGDDCLAIKGNSSNIVARNITCRGGNGIAFGSLGQYANMSDLVSNVFMEDLFMTRIDPRVQPNMANAVYFKSWDGSINGEPPTGGGGGPGSAMGIIAKNVRLDRVSSPTHITQANGGHSGDKPSQYRFGDIHFIDWSGTATGNTLVSFGCSPAVGCSDISFHNFNIEVPAGQTPRFLCQNVTDITGLPAPCTAA